LTGALIALGIFGTALLYGDGLITPAISVLSAVEGLEQVTTAFDSWIIPIAVAILIALFLVQPRGTTGIAKVFSPVMVLWFVFIAVLGVSQIVQSPGVLRAIWPGYAVSMFIDQPLNAFIALGSIFLVVTGGEALYADMGHFGRKSIQVSWYVIVFPALIANYFGQAALMARDPATEESPFFEMVPEALLVPSVILATAATVIASQALISGAFSLTAQAIQLDYLPRLEPLLVGLGLVVQMTTWRRGRQIVAERVQRGRRPIADVLDEARATGVHRPSGAAVYMFKGSEGAPPALITNLAHNHALHETTVVLSVDTGDTPRVEPSSRLQVRDLGDGVYRVVISYGFMEDPDVVEALAGFAPNGVEFDPRKATYFIGRETPFSAEAEGMPIWREKLFEVLDRGAASAARFFNLPRDRVFEVGTQVEI